MLTSTATTTHRALNFGANFPRFYESDEDRSPQGYEEELNQHRYKALLKALLTRQDSLSIPEHIFERESLKQEVNRLLERESLKQEVNRLLESAGEENWDGEGALAITRSLVEIAHEVIEQLPVYAGKPDVEATPHGEIDFDWVVDQNTMLTVSVAAPKVIAFAGTFPEARLKGEAEWTGELPHFVECCLKQIGEL